MGTMRLNRGEGEKEWEGGRKNGREGGRGRKGGEGREKRKRTQTYSVLMVMLLLLSNALINTYLFMFGRGTVKQ